MNLAHLARAILLGTPVVLTGTGCYWLWGKKWDVLSYTGTDVLAAVGVGTLLFLAGALGAILIEEIRWDQQ